MIDKAVKNKLCTNCGTCISACPLGAVFCEKDENGYLVKVDKGKCNKCGLCIKVCPGIGVDLEDLGKDIFSKGKETKYNPNLGYFRRCYLGYSRDQDLRFNCSSGGVVTSILVFLLKNKIIDGALVTTMDPQKPLVAKPFIAYSEEEIVKARGSKYTPVILNALLKEIIRSKKQNFAVVGLPCHIHGIRKLQKINPILKKKIKVCLGLMCGQGVSFSGTAFLLKQLRLKTDEVKTIHFRGNGWPGDITVVSKNGSVKRIPYLEAFKTFTMGFFTPPRCFLCADLTNELADISFGDAWMPEIINGKRGVNFIITRTQLGQKLLDRAKKYIFYKAVDPSLISESKKIRLFCKKESHKLLTIVAKFLRRGIPSYSEMPKGKFKPLSIIVVIFYLNSFLSNKYLKLLLMTPLFAWNLPLITYRKILDIYKKKIIKI